MNSNIFEKLGLNETKGKIALGVGVVIAAGVVGVKIGSYYGTTTNAYNYIGAMARDIAAAGVELPFEKLAEAGHFTKWKWLQDTIHLAKAIGD